MTREQTSLIQSPEAKARALEGLRLLALIEEKLKAGAELTKPKSGDFLNMFRARVERYRGDIIVSPGSLRWLKDILKKQLRVRK